MHTYMRVKFPHFDELFSHLSAVPVEYAVSCSASSVSGKSYGRTRFMISAINPPIENPLDKTIMMASRNPSMAEDQFASIGQKFPSLGYENCPEMLTKVGTSSTPIPIHIAIAAMKRFRRVMPSPIVRILIPDIVTFMKRKVVIPPNTQPEVPKGRAREGGGKGLGKERRGVDYDGVKGMQWCKDQTTIKGMWKGAFFTDW